MRRFTSDEELEYNKCKVDALAEITSIHQAEIDAIKDAIDNTISLTESLKADLKKSQARLRQTKKNNKNTHLIDTEIAAIKKEQIENRLNKKTNEKELKGLYKLIEEETKPLVKKKFDYEIPIAKIDDAGITTTGTASEGNQLPQLVSEYFTYRMQNDLWALVNNNISYVLNSNNLYCRSILGQEVVLNEQ